MDDPFFIDPEEEVASEGSREKEKEEETKERALKLPPFSRFIKEFIAGKAKTDGKIVIGENISAVIQKRKLPSKRADPPGCSHYPSPSAM
ncbi:hypothetical protein AAHA92_34004 [Salvia divinorum]|uniref:Uncharacterized protein n=1 Tax=Salvia divinorum TaxID=28513 RepID=A0ABD1FHJ3_SALDI